MSYLLLIGASIYLVGCSTSGPGIFAKKTPHEQYAQKLSDAGLKTTAMGSAWLSAAETSLVSPNEVSVPYREKGFFESEVPAAVGLKFAARKGEKLNMSISHIPTNGFVVFFDFWEFAADGKAKLLQAGDSTRSLEYEVRKDGNYLLRVQPELLKSGEYSIHISSGPSLAYPIKAPGTNHVKSFWGADRDAGARRHEGIDLFAARNTPVVASADGHVTRVNENNLGGKVVWLRPDKKDYTLYYAHLDSQLVITGQQVKEGDTLGLMGNTGNARTTAPHLHFGIYGNSGPVDPFPFVNPQVRRAPENISPFEAAGKLVRMRAQSKIHVSPDSRSVGTPVIASAIMKVEAATNGWYRVGLPNGLKGFVSSSAVTAASSPLRRSTLAQNQPLLASPDSLGGSKKLLEQGTEVNVLGVNDQYYFIESGKLKGWIAR